ncbi:hypothetical protein LXL04_026549 [Taraxacum kok-saghyz]
MISNCWLSEVTREKYDISLASLAFSLITLAILWYKFGKATPPGPRGLPLVSYFPFLGTNLHLEFTKISQRYGPIFKLKLGSKTFIVISSSDEIFANRDSPVAGLVLFYGGQSILWSDNNSFLRNMRKVFVYQVQSKKNLEASRSFRRGRVREAVKHVYETIGSEVDIGTIAFSTSLSVITSMLWGKSLVEYENHSKLGGTDTTSTMAEWTMAELLRNPDVLKKIQEELEQVVGLNHMVEESHLPRRVFWEYWECW